MEQIGVHTLKRVAVTGGGSGIGRAICHGLAQSGLEVVALGRTQSSLDETAQGHAGIVTKTIDVRDPDDCARVFAQLAAHYGAPMDGLVVSAAIYPKVHFLDQTPDSFTDTVLTNIVGGANVVRAVLPDMLARNMGRIVVLGSLADNNPIPSAIAYSVSKGGLHALIKGIAAEIDPARYPNVLINELIPGATQTAMSDFGQSAEAVVPFVCAELDRPSGGPSGTCWYNGKQIRFGETWKGALKRTILRRG